MRSQVCGVLAIWLGMQVAGDSLAVQDAASELSCATFPADLSETGLIARYGSANVRSAPVFGSDDGPQDGTVVFPNVDAMKLEAVWWDAASKTRLHWVRAHGDGGRWQAPNGITVGMDLRTIERANGWPFRLAALSTEGQGAVRSWRDGRLKRSDVDGCRVSINLFPIGGEAADPRLSRQVIRGREFSSGHPAMQALNPRVGAIWVIHSPR
jgi:hypothetical protein